MQPVRIAAVRYLNTAPLIEGLDKVQGLTVIPAIPSVIADMVKSNQADLGLASIVDAVGLPGTKDPELTLVPVGMIGCDGPTLTVRLFSAVPLDKITTLHADTDSHTSVILAQLLLHKLHRIRPKVISFDARERQPLPSPALSGRESNAAHPNSSLREELVDLSASWPVTVLLIGDKVITDHPPDSRYPHQLDLGEAWHELTGLPFVYAMWMCRAAETDSPRIATAAGILDRQRRRNTMRLDWIVEKRAPEARWPRDQAGRYLGELLRFAVGEREREAVARFLKEAGELGLVAGRTARWREEHDGGTAIPAAGSIRPPAPQPAGS
jgi:chorismate dehydratase